MKATKSPSFSKTTGKAAANRPGRSRKPSHFGDSTCTRRLGSPGGAVRFIRCKNCGITINNTATQNKAARGTKRACQACETRFYDLAREPIVCPSCGVPYVAVARPTVSAARAASPTGKTGWRSKGLRHTKPSVPTADQEEAEVEPEIAQDASEETPSTVPEDDLVLEQEPDDPNVTDLIGHDIDEPKER
jgi:uncharacterized protein (TIGR02300 family)